MITIEKLLTYDKNNLKDVSESLNKDDVHQLIKWLNQKENTIRYYSLLLLQHRSKLHGDIYPYWDVFLEKLNSDNSYQRNIGLILMAENARWDQYGKLDKDINLYLSFCDDEKPITVRQCVQSLSLIVEHKQNLRTRILDKLISMDIMRRKETQRKILLMDILKVLVEIQKQTPNEEIEKYTQDAMTGGILDREAKRKILRYMAGEV